MVDSEPVAGWCCIARIGPIGLSSHGDTLAVLRDDPSGKGVEVSPAADAKISAACFENVVRDDLTLGGRKVGGAAQRRSRYGLLHQGSVLGFDVPDGFAEELAAALAKKVVAPPVSENEHYQKALALIAERYATREWREKF